MLIVKIYGVTSGFVSEWIEITKTTWAFIGVVNKYLSIFVVNDHY